jgi:hypothetical protein
MSRSNPYDHVHIVLVPGFGAFDALGQVEYYAGVTPLFRNWKRRTDFPVTLHYFDNLPSAAVTTRASRLRSYLAKRIVRERRGARLHSRPRPLGRGQTKPTPEPQVVVRGGGPHPRRGDRGPS